MVATAAPGTTEVVANGETGLLVPRGDAVALGDAIAELASDPARRETLGRAAHARAQALYDVQRMARDYARICLEAS